MRTLRTVGELREAVAQARADGARVGLVPTMGALHEGHLSLIRRARRDCGLVVVSLFVNPSQFNDRADLERYPRQEADDAELALAAGADVLFAPSVAEVYPDGFSTAVEVLGVTSRYEGAQRGSEHFRGVATVVAKLLGMCQPDAAYFGRKDAQQLVVIRRLVADLNLPVRIEGLPTVREHDGVARSSRNALLSPAERARARALPAALEAARRSAADGTELAADLIERAVDAMRAFDVTPSYVALVDPDTFEPVERLLGPALLVLAARIGEVRLIDNDTIEPAPSAGAGSPEGGALASCNA